MGIEHVCKKKEMNNHINSKCYYKSIGINYSEYSYIYGYIFYLIKIMRRFTTHRLQNKYNLLFRFRKNELYSVKFA